MAGDIVDVVGVTVVVVVGSNCADGGAVTAGTVSSPTADSVELVSAVGEGGGLLGVSTLASGSELHAVATSATDASATPARRDLRMEV